MQTPLLISGAGSLGPLNGTKPMTESNWAEVVIVSVPRWSR